MSETPTEFEEALAQIERLFQARKRAEVVTLCDQLADRYAERFELYYHRAQAKAIMGDRDGALDDISTAIRLQSSEPALFFFRGMWNVNAGQFREAIDDLSEAIALEQSIASTYYLGSARFIRSIARARVGDFEGAQEDCNEVKPSMSLFVAGRLWTVANVRELLASGGSA